MILRDTLGDAIVLSIFDFIMGFVVLFAIGLLIRGLKYVEVMDRGLAEPEVRVRTSAANGSAAGAQEPGVGSGMRRIIRSLMQR